jgi:cytosine deaminase
MSIRRGTTAIRAETEFDPLIGLAGIEVMLDLKRRYAPLVDIQVVAFPQEGVHKSPGTEDLFWRAMQLGADVVGGIPYNDLSAERHIDLVFEIARAFDKPISLHQDFRDDGLELSIEYVARKTIETGWHGRVEVGHATALGALEPDRLERVAALLRAANISVITLPLTDLHLGGRHDAYNVRRGLAPVRFLLEAGVNVACSSNNIRNAFTPFGNADPLVVAMVLLAAAHLGGADTLPGVLELITTNGARAIGIRPDYGLAVGKRADLVILDTYSVQDAVIDLPERLWVIKSGRVTVVNRVASEITVSPLGGVHGRP